MKNVEIKAMYLWNTSKTILDSFQTYDEWKRQGKKVARGQKACAYIPMWRPFKVNKDVEKNGEKTNEEFTLFHIQLVAIFHEGQLEGNEWKTLDKTIIENIENKLKEHWLYNVSKEEYITNVKAFERRCKQYDDKVEVKEEVKEEEIEKRRKEIEEGSKEIEKQMAEEMLEEERKTIERLEERIEEKEKAESITTGVEPFDFR